MIRTTSGVKRERELVSEKCKQQSNGRFVINTTNSITTISVTAVQSNCTPSSSEREKKRETEIERDIVKHRAIESN